MLGELAETKLRIADDFTDGAQEQLWWEAAEHLTQALHLLGSDEEPSLYVRERGAWLWLRLARVLKLLGLPARKKPRLPR